MLTADEDRLRHANPENETEMVLTCPEEERGNGCGETKLEVRRKNTDEIYGCRT